MVDWAAKELNRCAIIADLTNVLRIGDVIVPNGAGSGIIFEFKATQKGPKKAGYANRAARQLLRMERMAEYLHEDRGRVFGTDEEIFAISVQHSHEYIYEHVDAAYQDALEIGFCAYQVSDHDVLFCVRSDQDLGAWLNQAPSPPFRFAAIGFHSRFMSEEVHPVIKPMPAWPVSLRVRQALLNREIFLTHLVDPLAIVGFAECGWLIEGFSRTTSEYNITAGNDSLVAPEVWLDRWLYGFETGSSVASAMVECASEGMQSIKNSKL